MRWNGIVSCSRRRSGLQQSILDDRGDTVTVENLAHCWHPIVGRAEMCCWCEAERPEVHGPFLGMIESDHETLGLKRKDLGA